MSRRHASIERTDLGTLATDLGSTNGTYLGDTRIVAAYLSAGARLRIGSSVLEVRASGAAGWGAKVIERLAADLRREFPDMKGLADYVHSKGLKVGIYSSPGPQTCAGYEGSYQHEEVDAKT